MNSTPRIAGLSSLLLLCVATLAACRQSPDDGMVGSLELLIATPVRTLELMLAKIAPYVLIGLVQVSLILALGHLLFKVPIRGSLLDVYLVALVFIIANLYDLSGEMAVLGLFIPVAMTLAMRRFTKRLDRIHHDRIPPSAAS